MKEKGKLEKLSAEIQKSIVVTILKKKESLYYKLTYMKIYKIYKFTNILTLTLEFSFEKLQKMSLFRIENMRAF